MFSGTNQFCVDPTDCTVCLRIVCQMVKSIRHGQSASSTHGRLTGQCALIWGGGKSSERISSGVTGSPWSAKSRNKRRTVSKCSVRITFQGGGYCGRESPQSKPGLQTQQGSYQA